MSTVIIDYGVGNIFSLRQSLLALGEDAVVSGDHSVIAAAPRIILPGVGAFGDAADKLRATGLDRVITRAAARGVPLLGICLGMQLLFERSYEFGECEGLGLIPGEVRSIREVIPENYKVPHIGWNSLSGTGEYVYFVHSFQAVCPKEYITATTDYGAELTASVRNNNVFGTQYHPEKSGAVGLGILRAFLLH